MLWSQETTTRPKTGLTHQFTACGCNRPGPAALRNAVGPCCALDPAAVVKHRQALGDGQVRMLATFVLPPMRPSLPTVHASLFASLQGCGVGGQSVNDTGRPAQGEFWLAFTVHVVIPGSERGAAAAIPTSYQTYCRRARGHRTPSSSRRTMTRYPRRNVCPRIEGEAERGA